MSARGGRSFEAPPKLLFRVLPLMASTFSVLVGGLVFLDWLGQLSTLPRILSEPVTVDAATAIACVMLGLALLTLPKASGLRCRKRFSQSCAIAAVLIGVSVLLNSGSAPLGGPDSLGIVSVPSAESMSLNGAIVTGLLGISLWLMGQQTRRGDAIAQSLTVAAGLVVWLALIGYLYGVPALYQVASTAPMPLLVALLLLLLCTGLLFIRVNCGWMSVVANDRISGFIARRLLFTAFIAPIGLGWVIVQGVRAGLYDSILGVALLVAISTIIFVLLIGRSIITLDRRDQERQQAEIALRQANQQLEQAAQTQQYLAETSKTLFNSLDYQTTLANVAHLSVPQLADICTVVIVEENGAVVPLAAAAVQPDCAIWLNELRHKYPFDPNDLHGVASVIRTGVAQLHTVISEDLLMEAAQTPEHLDILQQAGLKSAMVVPLTARGRTLGAIAFFATLSERHYQAADLELAEEVGRRAGIAIDNARLYQAAQRARVQAETANRSKDEFLATLSHELRTPLNSMLGWTQLLASRRLDATTTARALETLNRNTRMLATIIEDLLDVSRIITGKLRLSLAPVPLKPIVEAAIEAVRNSASTKNIQLAADLDLSDHAIVMADANRLQQVIWNLLSNAVKFTPEGGQIQICAVPHQQTAKISVSDTGVGIQPALLPHVFDRFWQADSSATRSYGGLGLGLTIVQHLVEQHNGTIQVDSPGEGQGTTFVVQLPLLIQSPDSGYLSTN